MTTTVTIRTLVRLDVTALKNEALRLRKAMVEGENNGITNVFFIDPDLTVGEKNTLQTLIDKIGTGSVT